MSYLPVKVYSVDLASGATLVTTALDLQHSYAQVYLEVPAIASGNLFVQASNDNSTFRRVMFHGTVRVTDSKSIASAATLTGAYDLGEGKVENVHYLVPSFASGTAMFLQVSLDGSTYRRLSRVQANTSTVAVDDFSIASAASGKLVPLPVDGFRYFKIEMATGQTDTTTTHKVIYTRTGIQDFEINSATSGRFIPIPVAGRYLKIESSSGITDTTTTFKVLCLN